MEKTDDTFAIRLLRAQASKNLTQAQLADALDTRASVIHAWQNGEAKPKIETLVRLAKVLGVSTDYLCGLEEVKNYTEAAPVEVVWMVKGQLTEFFTNLEEAHRYANTIGSKVIPLVGRKDFSSRRLVTAEDPTHTIEDEL